MIHDALFDPHSIAEANPGCYLPPRMRITALRQDVRHACRAEIFGDPLGPDAYGRWRKRYWIEHGIMGIPGVSPHWNRDAGPADLRRWIAHEDWRARHHRKHRFSPRIRRIVMERAVALGDGQHRCRYCMGWMPERLFAVDHVIPASRGGPSVLWNLVAACLSCNARKSDLLLHEWFPLQAAARRMNLRVARVLVARYQADPRLVDLCAEAIAEGSIC